MEANLKVRSGFLQDGGTLLDGLRMGGVGVWRWKINTDDLEWSGNLEQIHRLPAGTFNGALSSFRSDVHPDDLPFVLQAIEQAVETKRPYTAVYRTAPSDAGDTVWIEASGGTVITPDGAEYLTGICTDVTNRVRGELELERRLAQQKAIEQFGSFALIEPELGAIMQRATEIAAEVLGVPLTKVLQFESSGARLKLVAGVGWQAGLVGSATVGVDGDFASRFYA